MIRNVQFYPKELAEQLEGRPTAAVISITSPPPHGRLAKLRDGWGAKLCLQFEDLSQPWQNYPIFTRGMAQAVVNFVIYQRQTAIEELVVHCEAGVSRSVAVAAAVGRNLGISWGPGDGHYAMDVNRQFRVLRDSEPGNPLVYRLLMEAFYANGIRILVT